MKSEKNHENANKTEKHIYEFEFYNRITNTLEHNGSYSSIEEAYRDAHGRVAICTGSIPNTSTHHQAQL